MSRRLDRHQHERYDSHSRRDYHHDDRRDRSRSRDSSHGRHGHDDRGSHRSYHGGGHGDRGGFGDRGGHGGRARFGNRGRVGGFGGWGVEKRDRKFTRPDSGTMMVKTNYFKIDVVPDQGTGPMGPRWAQYRVEIFSAKRAKDQNKFEYLEDGTPKLELGNLFSTERGSTPLSFRILSRVADKILKSENIHLVHDGSSTAYCPKDIPMDHGSDKRLFTIRVKRTCDDDEPDADIVSNAWFQVSLQKVTNVYPKDNSDAARQAMDIILRSSMISVGMTFFGKSPHVFYFPQNDQQGIARGSRELERMHRDEKTLPLIGLIQAVRFCESRNDFSKFYLNCGTAVDFANRSFDNVTKRPIPMLDADRGTICGVKVDLNRPIQDKRTMEEIESALRKLTFNVKYTRAEPDRIQSFKAKGLSEHEIERKCTSVRKNKFLRDDPETHCCIFWGADDPDIYSFEYKDKRFPDVPARKVTVAEYYLVRYHIRLRYPKMPIIFLGTQKVREWFPIEFLFQAFTKVKAPGDDENKAILKHSNDVIAGTKCIANISNLADVAFRKLRKLGFNVEHVLQQYNLRLDHKPVEVKARVLREPTIKFANEIEKKIRNGSWDLRGVQFPGAAAMNSFAVADLTGQNIGQSHFMKKMLEVASRHGIEVPPMFMDHSACIQRLNSLTLSQRCDNVENVGRAIDGAIECARRFFLSDGCRWFRHHGVWFKTRVRDGNEKLCECLVIPPNDGDDETLVSIILRFDEDDLDISTTHTVTYRGYTGRARLMKKVRGFEDLVDPFDFRYDSQRRQYEAYHEKKWVPTDQGQDVYQIPDGRYFHTEDAQFAVPFHRVEARRVECPSIIFVMLQEISTEIYSFAKSKCHFEHGIACQVTVNGIFNKQKNKDQYCSNVASKVNAKLSNSINHARSWTLHTSPSDLARLEEGVSWCNEEVPTMVLGISIANSVGSSDSYSVISVSATVNKECMHFTQGVSVCTRTELIDDFILSDLTKSMFINFKQYNGDVMPKRILVYRDGVSEGTFSRLQCEIQSIRRGFLKALEDTPQDTNKTCDCDSGCNLCCPLITFVVCMTRNNVKIVPSNASEGVKSNVYSGTCVDTDIIDNLSNLRVTPDVSSQRQEFEKNGFRCFTESDGKGYDFLLTAHGAGLGTSKPVHYRIILNENAVLGFENEKSTALTKEKLEQLTYEMSFQYSTATKAVRVVPVVYYSSRLANMALSYFRSLIREGKVIPQRLEEVAEHRNGPPMSRFVYLRNDQNEESGNDLVSANLLPVFTGASAFSSHLSA